MCHNWTPTLGGNSFVKKITNLCGGVIFMVEVKISTKTISKPYKKITDWFVLHVNDEIGSSLLCDKKSASREWFYPNLAHRLSETQP